MRTALLVERDASLRSAVCDLITPGGVRIVCARAPAEAIALLEEGLRPRLVVVDLPRTAGREARRLLRWLRADPARDACSVLLLCDQPASRRTHALVARYGALGALPAAVEEWRLLQLVDRLCGRSRRAASSR
jgi:CheY-like chemotaxis protein